MGFGAFHPGETLREALAGKLRMPPEHLHGIICGERAVTPEVALRLGRYFGNEAEFWMNLQTQHDLAEVRRTRGERIAAEVEQAA